MNAAMITIALAGMSFGGFTFINATGAPSATPSNGGAVPVMIPEEARRQADKTHAFDIEQASMLESMNKIAFAFDRQVVISIGLREQNFALENDRAIFTLSGQYTVEQAINEIKQQAEIGNYQLELTLSDTEIKFQTLDEYLRSLIETRVYPNPSWITQTHEQATYAESLRELLGVQFDLNYTSIQIIGNSIVVAAPPNIHAEFVQLTKELDEVIGKRDASMKSKRDQAKAEIEHRRSMLDHEMQRKLIEQATRRQVVVDRLQTEFNAVRSKLLENKEKHRLVESEIATINVFDPKRHTKEEYLAQLLSLTSSREVIEFELDEIEERYFCLRSRLVESQYADLFEGLE